MSTLKPGQPTDDMSHDIERTPATELAPGVTLYTKDGSQIGNAILVKQVGHEIRRHMENTLPDQPLWLIETDFGNRAKLTQSEIEEWFTLGHVSEYHRWSLSRDELIKTNVADDFFGERRRKKT